MSQVEMVDAEIIEHKFVGPNFVIIRLPDGTECKLTMEVRVVKVKDQKNPDGTPMYNLNWTILHSWKTPVGRVIKIPKPPIPPTSTKAPDKRAIA